MDRPKESTPRWVPETDTLSASAASLMAVIDASGGNPSYPHGGTAFTEALWHVARHLLVDGIREDLT